MKPQPPTVKIDSRGMVFNKPIVKRVFEPGFFGAKVKPLKFSGEFLAQYFTNTQSAEEIKSVVSEA